MFMFVMMSAVLVRVDAKTIWPRPDIELICDNR